MALYFLLLYFWLMELGFCICQTVTHILALEHWQRVLISTRMACIHDINTEALESSDCSWTFLLPLCISLISNKCTWVFCIYISIYVYRYLWMCNVCASDVLWHERRTLDSLVLELWIAGNFWVSVRIWFRNSAKATCAPNCWLIPFPYAFWFWFWIDTYLLIFLRTLWSVCQ